MNLSNPLFHLQNGRKKNAYPRLITGFWRSNGKVEMASFWKVKQALQMSGPIISGYYLTKLVPEYMLAIITSALLTIFPLHMEHFTWFQLKQHIQRKDKQSENPNVLAISLHVNKKELGSHWTPFSWCITLLSIGPINFKGSSVHVNDYIYWMRQLLLILRAQLEIS